MAYRHEIEKRNRKRAKSKNLKAYDELFLFINVEIVELVEFFIKNPNEPFMEIHQGGLVIKAVSTSSIIMMVLVKIGIWGGRIGEVPLEELLKGLIAEKLVPPRREGLLHVGRELLPEFHCSLWMISE